jgi:hypothetical protein
VHDTQWSHGPAAEKVVSTSCHHQYVRLRTTVALLAVLLGDVRAASSTSHCTRIR